MANDFYNVNYTDQINKAPIIVEDGDINDIDTSLSFPGQGVTGYAKLIAENSLHLLENFAFSEPPEPAVEGQLWYDNSAGVDQLKINDGTRWVPASGIFKAGTVGEVTNAIAGDLWVDTAGQQLYLNTGSGWVLVGPEFSQGSSTGPRSAILTATDNISYPVLIFDVNETPVAIVSQNRFRPKSAIEGFGEINLGINLSTKSTPAGLFKLQGIAATAESLRIQNKDVPAGNFLRSDINTTANGILSVKNNQGIRVGNATQLTLQTSGQRGLISNNSSGAGIDFQVNRDGNVSTVLRLNSDIDSTGAPGIGINTLNPTATLDITGTLKVSNAINATSVEDTVNPNTGALRVAGGAWVAKDLRVGADITTAGNIAASGNITGTGNVTGFNEIRANKFIGAFETSTTISGDIDGNSATTTKLLSSTNFEIVGDVTAPAISFDGNGSPTLQFTTTISDTFFESKTAESTANSNDVILIDRPGETSLRTITQGALVATVPTNPPGMIVPYGGSTAPPGWLMCNGQVVDQIVYSDLFNVIGYSFLDLATLDSLGHPTGTVFAVPDFRGRFPLGNDSMGGTPANRVTSNAADNVGNSSGSETADIEKRHLPDHEHDLRSNAGDQYYAIRDIDVPANPDEEVALNLAPGTDSASGIPSSGKIVGGGQTGNNDYRTVAGNELGAPLNTMNPYTTVNYIIWTGVV